MRDPDQLSADIGEIYDCVLEPAKWQRVLARICDQLSLMHGVLGLYTAQTGQPLLRIQHGMSREWFDLMPSFGIEMAMFWGGSERIAAYPLGELVIHSVANPEIGPETNRFAKEWCQPQGIRDMAALSLAKDDNAVGTLVFTASRRLEETSVGELEILRLLSPHIRRAVSISRLLDFKTIQTNNLHSAFEVLPNGLALVTSSGRLLYANQAARALMRENDAIRVVEGRLTMRDDDAAAALDEALGAASRGPLLCERGAAIPALGSNSHRAVLHILPLHYGALRTTMDAEASVAIFMSKEASYAAPPTDALRVLYGLTPAEVRICELMMQGLTPNEISEQIGVAVSTARTHLLRIFQKTGTDRQADLIRLVASLVIPDR